LGLLLLTATLYCVIAAGAGEWKDRGWDFFDLGCGGLLALAFAVDTIQDWGGLG
jgi:hypothetical protein